LWRRVNRCSRNLKENLNRNRVKKWTSSFWRYLYSANGQTDGEAYVGVRGGGFAEIIREEASNGGFVKGIPMI